MRLSWKSLAVATALIGLSPAAHAANSAVPAMTAATSVVGTDLLYCIQSSGTLDRKCTPAQMAAYIYGLTSGDATINGTGAVTFATVNANVGAFGSATQCVAHTVNAKGLITATSAVTCTPAIGSLTGTGTGVITALGVNVGTAGSVVVNGGALGTPSSGTATNLTGTAAGLTAGNVTTNANLTGAVTSSGNATSLGSFTSAQLLAALTTKTGSGSAVFGTAPTIDSLNATTAMTLAWITGSTQCLQVNTSGVVSGTGSGCGGSGSTGANPTATAGPTANNGVATTFMRSDASPAVQQGSASQKGIVQVDGTTLLASSGVISAAPTTVATSVQTGANYPFLTGDQAKLVYLNNASNQVPTIPQAGTTGFAASWFVQVCNIGAGTQTITPTISTIGGAASYLLPAASAADPACVAVVSDGSNYVIAPDFTKDASRFSAGVLAAARGGAGTITGALKANGSGVVSQAACADLSNAQTGCSTATGTSGGTLPLLNGANTWSATQTFGPVVGTVTTQSGTTYTFASSDCGTTVRFSNAGAVTATIPQGLPVGCNIAVMQAAAGQVSVNGSAVTPATLQSAHSYTKTFGAGAIIGLFNDATNHVVLTGDGA
ncbi:hypothetical protein [Bradyrhizobium sp. WSM1417]|uniref:beta strand repeat-containing protein n=1 Tax=Bradyrhizobium sp. WSM1417 TaxID=754500 RepID=UPI0004B6A08B|nr:hypothetical protein [Bradyrhizobium sp. WSM1417]